MALRPALVFPAFAIFAALFLPILGLSASYTSRLPFAMPRVFLPGMLLTSPCACAQGMRTHARGYPVRMATTQSGQAAQKQSTTKASAASAGTSPKTENDNQPSAEDIRRDDGQLAAHLAQQEVAKRTPIVEPDLVSVREAKGDQLSDWERSGSKAYPDVDQSAIDKDLAERSAKTPAQKRREGHGQPGQPRREVNAAPGVQGP